jgi:hypothetical protein
MVPHFLALTLLLVTSNCLAQQEQRSHVGRATCIACHREEHSLWTGSHHDLAMLELDDEACRAPFDGTEVSSGGVLSRFLLVDDSPVIEVEDADGKKTLPVRYFFGTSPCQQVLVAGANGRLQSYPWHGQHPRRKGEHAGTRCSRMRRLLQEIHFTTRGFSITGITCAPSATPQVSSRTTTWPPTPFALAGKKSMSPARLATALEAFMSPGQPGRSKRIVRSLKLRCIPDSL